MPKFFSRQISNILSYYVKYYFVGFYVQWRYATISSKKFFKHKNNVKTTHCTRDHKQEMIKLKNRRDQISDGVKDGV